MPNDAVVGWKSLDRIRWPIVSIAATKGAGNSPLLMSNEADPLKRPPRRPYEPKADDDGYWSKPSFLSWYSSLGIRGRLVWAGGIFTAVNAISFFFGFFWPRMFFGGLAALLIGLLLPSSVDE